MTSLFNNVGKGDNAQIRLLVREQNKGWRTQIQLQIYQNKIVTDFKSYIRLSPKTDIKIQAKKLTANAMAVSVGYDMYLVG